MFFDSLRRMLLRIVSIGAWNLEKKPLGPARF
jgi:hypothetical protein